MSSSEDHINAQYGKGFVHRPSGPVHQHFGDVYHVPAPPTPDPSSPPFLIEALRAPDKIFGRTQELDDIEQLFTPPPRTITIRGVGGIGKTTLARALARRLRFHFHEGIFALSLALAGGRQLSAAEVRHCLSVLLGVQDRSFENPDAATEQQDALVAAVRGRERLLIIFDNYETMLWRLGRDTETDISPRAADLPPDEYTPLERLIERARDIVRQHGDDEKISIMGVLQWRVQETIYQARLYGGSQNTSEERNRALYAMNRMVVKLTGTPLTDAVPAMPPPGPDIVQQYREARAVHQLVYQLAQSGVSLLFTTRQSPVGVPGEVFYPEAKQGGQLNGLDSQSSIALMQEHKGQGNPSSEFLKQLSEELASHPLAMQLAISRWAGSREKEEDFLAHLHEELLKARIEGQSDHLTTVVVNVRLSVDALSPTLRDSLLTLSIVANSVILPGHGAVVWGMQQDDEKTWLVEQAHEPMQQLCEASLLMGYGYDEERNRFAAYGMQPVVRGVVGSLATEAMLEAPRARYAAWADGVVSRAFGEGGVGYDADVAQSTLRVLEDLPAACPCSPPRSEGGPPGAPQRYSATSGNPPPPRPCSTWRGRRQRKAAITRFLLLCALNRQTRRLYRGSCLMH